MLINTTNISILKNQVILLCFLKNNIFTAPLKQKGYFKLE
jgi:hypothetical protein